jgi:hypothetical protein
MWDIGSKRREVVGILGIRQWPLVLGDEVFPSEEVLLVC